MTRGQRNNSERYCRSGISASYSERLATRILEQAELGYQRCRRTSAKDLKESPKWDFPVVVVCSFLFPLLMMHGMSGMKTTTFLVGWAGAFWIPGGVAIWVHEGSRMNGAGL